MSAYVELAKLGAIGVSVICLLLAFRWSAQVTRLARELTPDRLKLLTTHARWTMSFAMAFLAVALIAEIIDKKPVSTDVGVELVPSDFDVKTKNIKLLTLVPEPIRIKLAGDTDAIHFKSGTGHLTIAAGSIVSVDVNEMVSAMETAQAIAAGQELALAGKGGELRQQQ
jgi:hypothetical protein